MSIPKGLPSQFINWRLIERNGKHAKVPCDTKGHAIDPLDSQNWIDHPTAKKTGFSVGFVLTENDPYFFLDLDKCFDHETNDWSYEAKQIVSLFPGAWGEVSQSGAGLHIFGKCDKSLLKNSRNKWDGWKEFYTQRRFIAFGPSGWARIHGVEVDRDWTEVLKSIVPEREELANPSLPGIAHPDFEKYQLPDGCDPNYSALESDDELIDRARRSRSLASSFGQKASFEDLWIKREIVLSEYYPGDNKLDGFDRSSADLALMNHLAFWTGKDARRMDRLFRQSALIRPKYEKRPDYRHATIMKAIRSCAEVYSADQKKIPIDASMSDDQLATAIFENSWDGEMFYIPEFDRWANWNGKRWSIAISKHDPVTRLRRELRDALRSADGLRQNKRIGSLNTIKAVFTLMRSSVGAAKSINEWDVEPSLIGTPNGIVDLRSGIWRPRRRTDFLLKATSVDPAATGEPPTQWIKFLKTIFADNDAEIDFIQRLLGYGLTGSTKEHRLFIAYGTGRNGKSTLFNTYSQILSEDYSRTISPKLLLDKRTEQHATDLAYLKGARFARASELPPGRSWDEVLIKQITGGDWLTARFMRQDNFTFQPQCTLLVDANNIPALKGIDEAVRRRICLIPFDVTIPNGQEDRNLPDKLKNETAAILRWAIDGAVKWYESGLQIPQSIVDRSMQYIDDEDVLGKFVTDCLEKDSAAKITNESLRLEFHRWAQKEGITPWSTTQISAGLLKRGYQRYKSDRARGFRGLKRALELPGL
ncbi:MAG: phage/plasmid primase, P4 family [Henriciella sp.]